MGDEGENQTQSMVMNLQRHIGHSYQYQHNKGGVGYLHRINYAIASGYSESCSYCPISSPCENLGRSEIRLTNERDFFFNP